MKLSYFIRFLFESESEASKQAHKLGLESDGFGRWMDKNGDVVARTVHGKLVKVKAKVASAEQPAKKAPEEPPEPHNPHTTKTAIRMPIATDKNPRQSRLRSVNPTRRPEKTKMMGADATYRRAEFFAERINPSPEDMEKFNTATTAEELYDAIADIMEIDPYVDCDLYSEYCDQFKSVTGVTAFGLFSPQLNRIMLSSQQSEALEELTKLTVPGLMKTIREAAKGFRGLETQAYMALFSALHTLVHEGVHAKDANVARMDVLPKINSYQSYIVEGLTEIKAQEILIQLTNAPYLDTPQLRNHWQSYHHETTALRLLDSLEPDDPILAKLWETPHIGNRLAMISGRVKKHSINAINGWIVRSEKIAYSPTYREANPDEDVEKELDDLKAAYFDFKMTMGDEWEWFLVHNEYFSAFMGWMQKDCTEMTFSTLAQMFREKTAEKKKFDKKWAR